MTKYSPLRSNLESADRSACSMSFEAIADLVGGLPASALNHRAWWSNDPSRSQAAAWLAAGRTVDRVDLALRTVSFSARSANPTKRSARRSRRIDALWSPNSFAVTAAALGPAAESTLDVELFRAGVIVAGELNVRPEAPAAGRVRHRYGDGPFARLQMPKLPDAPGIYVWHVDGMAVYVGCTKKSLRGRLGPGGYAAIATYNTLAAERGKSNGGQQTNCRVNALANAALVAGSRIELWVGTTSSGDALRAERDWMLRNGVPAWNARDER